MPGHPSDPFQPPDDAAKPSLELARAPVKVAQEPAREEPPRPVPIWQRAPLKYVTPRSSLITLVVLVFAIVGAFTITIGTLKGVESAVAGFVKRMLEGSGDEKSDEPPVYTPVVRDDAVLVRVEVTPADARLTLDGEPIESNPLRLPRNDKVRRLVAAAAGYAPAFAEIAADKAKVVRLKLTRLEPSK